jgi:phage RecT family recombinase
MANETTAIALTDEQVRANVGQWGDLYVRPIYHGRERYEEWLMDAVLHVAQSDEIKKAIQDPQGKALFVRSLQSAAASGLSLNPQKGEAAIVAYNGKKGTQVNFMPMKNGLVRLAMRTGRILKIESGVVFEKDEFVPKKTSEGDRYEWSPALKDRGGAKAYFAFAKLADGTGVLEYWEKKEAQEWAKKYGNGKAWDEEKRAWSPDKFKPDSAWGKSFDGMAEKTVIKALLRGLYLPELDGALEADEAPEAGPDQAGAAPLAKEIEAAERKAAERAAEAAKDLPAEGDDPQGELAIY